ncbi:MAG TPA: hypothetical protein DEQ38_06405 [Elusimicrobia bacterium]|nr:MAG: hypothetical protein A2089_08870 [Elusimicrobia bacterium GWD2_63_28]HCC47733.1 hypothetical protein [Elusimicrobiota bacterium]
MGKILKWGLAAAACAVIGLVAYFFNYRATASSCLARNSAGSLKACNSMVSRLPDDRVAMYLASRAVLYEDAGKQAEALADLKRLAELHSIGKAAVPESTLLRTHERIAMLSAESGDVESTLTYGGKAVSMGSKAPNVHMMLGLAASSGKKYPEAIGYLRKAEEFGILSAQGANTAQFFYAYGRAALEAGDHETAFAYLSKAEPLMKDPAGLSRINKALGRALFEVKRYPEAKARLQAVLASGAECPECTQFLAAIAQAEKDAARTKRAARKKR